MNVAGNNPFGQVSGGYLKLLVKLVKVTISQRQRQNSGKAAYILPGADSVGMDRYLDASSLEAEGIGRCCLDMPIEGLGYNRALVAGHNSLERIASDQD